MRVGDTGLDRLARRLASGSLSRREALRLGGAALVGAAAISPADAIAKLTHHCPHGHVHCAGRCCPAGEVCLPPAHKGGKHRCGCPAHKTRCGSKCLDLRSDPAHCGACGHACATGEHCVNGQCTTTCASGQALCAGGCVTLASDPKNCGTCGHACQSGQVCSSGQCSSNCASGETACGGACANLQTDASNCGSCGHACPSGATCQNGTCSCPNGMTNCNGACVDLMTDFNNCGACGSKCCNYFASSSCQSGTCHIDSCSPNWVNCDGNPHKGCNCLGTNCGTATCETPVGC